MKNNISNARAKVVSRQVTSLPNVRAHSNEALRISGSLFEHRVVVLRRSSQSACNALRPQCVTSSFGMLADDLCAVAQRKDIATSNAAWTRPRAGIAVIGSAMLGAVVLYLTTGLLLSAHLAS